MHCAVDGVEVHYVEHGAGLPVLTLHGAGVDHREVAAAFEPLFATRAGYRRIYVDLPGMGRTPAANRLASNDDVVTLLGDFMARVAGGESFVLIGHSYGGYLARALAARRPAQCLGLAVLCPVAERSTRVPEHTVVRRDGDPYAELNDEQRAGFDEYFVVRTPALARRYRDHVVPGTQLVDEAGLGRIFANWALTIPADAEATYPRPVLVLAGRQDSAVGYADALELLERYLRASVAVIDGAGHALPHEAPELVAAHLDSWLAAVRAAECA